MRTGNLYPIVAIVGIALCFPMLVFMVMPPTEEKARPIDSVFKTEVSVHLNQANPELKTPASIEYHTGQG
ncbi:MAG: hypothetical protein Q8N58_00530, partial [bacterium]|nr:hypothetical protein [bacterium]